MGIGSEFVRQGNWLFRWRSYLPLIVLAPLGIGVATMKWPFGSYRIHEYWEFISLMVSLLGVAVRVITVGHTPHGTSGRNTHAQVADSLNTTGIYSTVRHPLYVGNFLIGLGVFLLPMEGWLVAIYTLSFCIYYERIMAAEEHYLRGKFGTEFDDWAIRTPAFIPNPRLWTKPSLPFSLRNVLKREYTALGLVILCHAMIETLEHVVIDHTFPIEPLWASVLALTGMSYLALRALKRHTRWLHVEGR